MNDTINVRIDRDLKKKSQEIAEELGLTLTDIVNSSFRNLVRTREVSFSAAPQMTPELERFLGPIERDVIKNKNLSPGFSSAEDAYNYLS